MTLRDLPPAEFARLSALMDEALDRPVHERERWIDALAQREPGAAELLRSLVASASANADGFLETREVIERHLQRDRAAAPSLVGESIGPWRVLRPLGRGGMGTVWLAERADGLFRRRVALKLVHQHLALAAAERFAREREILAALDHPNIARLLDAGFAPDGRPYLALEYVEGEALTAWSDAHRLPVRERIGLFMQVTRAVAFAHANLVIHRDLKPSNILVTADGQARLLDFGIAKLVRAGEPEATAVTQLAGPVFTPDYASPEQIVGGAVTTTSDVYALGVVLYELLCGARPYRLARATRAALEEAILAADPVRPSHAGIDAAVAHARGTTVRRLRRALSGDLDTIVMKALRKEAGERYATADALAQDLERHLRGEPVLARAPGAAYHLRKFVVRHRWGVAAGGIAATALLAGTAVSLWQANVAREQAARAEREATKAKVVQGFLLDLFRANSVEQSDPLQAQRTTARELLDLGARRAGSALAAVPEAQYEVQGTLADMYYQLGLTDEAALRQRDGIAAARRAFGPDDPRLAAALIAYADAIVDSSHRVELLPVLDEARTVLDAAGDTTSELRGRLLSMYAKAHSYTSMDETVRYADEAVAFYRRHHPATASVKAAMQSAAAARRQAGDFAGAEALYREALAEARRGKAGPSAGVVVPLVGIAQQRFRLGDVEGAERHYREALDVARQVYGERHGETIQTEVKLGHLLHRTGRRDEGRQLMAQAAAKAVPGADVPDFVVAVVAGIRGIASLAEGDLDAATPLVALDVADARANYPASAPLATALLTQAGLWSARGRYDEALAAIDEASAIELQVTPGAAAARMNGYHLDRAAILVAAGRPREALDTLDRVVPPRFAQREPLSPQEVQRQVVASDALRALGRADDAVERARSALALVEAAPTRRYYPALEADAAGRLGSALLQRGEAADARPLLERSADMRADLDVPTSPWLADARLALAACLRALGEPAQAAELERSARAATAQRPLGPHFRVAGLAGVPRR